MKKVYTLFASLIVMAEILSSCSKATVLSIDQTAFSIPNTGGSQVVTLTANKAWSASSDQSWCHVSPSSGDNANNTKVTITFDANTTYENRSCTVTFICDDMTSRVSVTQESGNGFIVPQTSYEVSSAAQQLEIPVQANVKFTVEVDESCKGWVKYKTTKSLTTSTVVLDIAENKTYDGREGKVTIKEDGGSLSTIVTIKQSQLDGLFMPETTKYNVSNEKQTLTIKVNTNVELEVIPEADWVKHIQTKGLSTREILLEVAENDTFDQRETKVNVKQKNGNLGGTITIKQDEKYGVLVTQSEYDLSNEATTIEVEVKYNVEFDVVIPEACKGWIKLISTKALSTNTYIFSISKNETYDNREGSITFKQKDGDMSASVVIRQAQTDYLEVDKREFSVDIPETNITISVTTNVDYTVNISESAKSWLSHVETKALSKEQVIIKVSAGTGDTDRTGTVTLISGKLSRTVTINQSAYANKIIKFADDKLKAKLVAAFDTNNDGELSIKEARAAKSIDGVFGGLTSYKSFDEFQYFEGVTAIPNYCFKDWDKMTSIILPSSLTRIGGSAFEGCKSLTSIDIPEKVNYISGSAFKNCSDLTSISIPGIVNIQTTAFSGCSNLTNLYIEDLEKWCNSTISVSCTHDNVGGINQLNGHPFGSGAMNPEKINHIYVKGKEITDLVFPDDIQIIGPSFLGCHNIHSITIPSSVESIGTLAFYGCTGVSSLDIPNNVETIGEAAFAYCDGLKSISMHEGVMYLRDYAFLRCKGLTSVTIPGSVESIGNRAFSDCKGLTSLTIQEGVKTIGSFAFYNCSGLKSPLVIPGSVETIGYRSFYGSGLTSLTLQEGIKSISDEAFYGCSGLTSSLTIPGSVETIGNGAFYYCKGLTSLIIQEGEKTIGNGAFMGCSGLTSLTIQDGVKSIGSQAFDNCSGLTSSLVIPGSVETINFMAFGGCSGLTSLTIQEGVKTIGYSAFSGCSGLTSSLVIPGSVKTIDRSAFCGCSGITSVTIPGSVEIIGESAFSDCSGLTSLTIQEGVKTISKYAFDDCYSLTSLTIPGSVEIIGESAFDDCYGLTSLTIPGSVESIGVRAFYHCSGLTSLTIPGSVEIIGNGAFSDCFSLTSLMIQDGVKRIGDQAFDGCNKLTAVTIPRSVEYIGNASFRVSTIVGKIIKFTIMRETPPEVNGNPFSIPPIVYVPKNSIEAYKSSPWKSYASDILAIPD